MLRSIGLRGEEPLSWNRFRWMGCLAAFVLVVCAPVAASAAEAFDLTVIQEAAGCAWTGTVDLDEQMFSAGCAASYTGTMMLSRVPGANLSCPAVISGDVTGTVSGNSITFGLASGGFGNVNFTGMITTTAEGEGASGTWTGDPGNGTWVALDFAGFGGATVSLTMTRPADGCEWVGPLSGAGAITIAGSVVLSRVAGDAPCPMTVSGPLSGKLFGTGVCFEVTSAELNTIRFIGTVNPETFSASGTWLGDEAGEGIWTAMLPRAGGTPVPAAALNGTGLAVLLGLLLAAGVFWVQRRPN